MQQQDQSVSIETTEGTETISELAPANEENEQAANTPEDAAGEAPASGENGQTADNPANTRNASVVAQPRKGFDWPALLTALAVAAFFALTARFNSQPSPSYIPAAVFSATGCGLLVTAVRKLRRRSGAGLPEAGLAGFGMALFQFAMTFSYPSVFTTITTAPEFGRAFLLTWGLVGLFATLLSLAGAAIGHLAFAPPRPLPEQVAELDNDEEEEEEDEVQGVSEEEDEEVETEQSIAIARASEQEEAASGQEPGEGEAVEQGEDVERDEREEEEVVSSEDEEEVQAEPQRSLSGYAITILLLGLLPMMIGYVFAATYDFVMQAINVNQISPALYPTLSLLGGLLPWRLAAPINLSSINGSFIVFTLLWRIPDSVLGNPNLFDVQTLEPLLFNTVGLALLLITMYGSSGQTRRQAAPWGIFLLLEALLGLILILPANLWMLRGLEGVLQLGNQVVQLPTFHLLNPILFLLNLLTGVLFCLLVSVIVRRQYQLWTTPRPAPEEEQVE